MKIIKEWIQRIIEKKQLEEDALLDRLEEIQRVKKEQTLKTKDVN